MRFTFSKLYDHTFYKSKSLKTVMNKCHVMKMRNILLLCSIVSISGSISGQSNFGLYTGVTGIEYSRFTDANTLWTLGAEFNFGLNDRLYVSNSLIVGPSPSTQFERVFIDFDGSSTVYVVKNRAPVLLSSTLNYKAINTPHHGLDFGIGAGVQSVRSYLEMTSQISITPTIPLSNRIHMAMPISANMVLWSKEIYINAGVAIRFGSKLRSFKQEF